MKKLILASLAVALSALTLAGCTRYVTLPPDQALVNGVAKLLEAKSFRASLETTVDQIPVTTRRFSNTFKSVTAHFDIDYSRRFRDGDRLRVGFKAQAADEQEFTGEVRFVQDELFFKLDRLPDTGELDLSGFTGADFELPLGALLPGFSTKMDEFSPLERAAAATVIRDTPDLFTGIQEISTEDIEGQSARHFTAQLNPDALERVAQQLAILGGSPQTVRPLNFESVTSSPLDLWVATKSGALVRVRGPFEDQSGRTGTLDLTIRDYNDRIAIDPYKDPTVLTFEELLKRLGTPGNSADRPDDEPTDQESSEEAEATEGADQTNQPAATNNSAAPGVDVGNSTTPYVPEVPFPIQ